MRPSRSPPLIHNPGLTVKSATPANQNKLLSELSATRLKLLRRAGSRHGRARDGLFTCEGLRCCREAVAHRPDWLEFVLVSAAFADSANAAELLAACGRAGIGAVCLPERDFAALAATETPQGVLALGRQQEVPLPNTETLAAEPFSLVLDRLNDPGNLGTILRTAWSIGLRRVWCTRGTTDAFGPKAVRAGMGAQFALDIHVLDDLAAVAAALAARGVRCLWLTSPRQGVGCFSPEFALAGAALVFGNEAQGLETPAAGAGFDYVTIPMPGAAESLNVAQAATVLMFEAVRRGLCAGRQSLEV